MSVLFFLIVPISWYIFNRQEQRHRFERSLFLTFEQLQENTFRPQRDMAESLLVLLVGVTVCEVGAVILWSALSAYITLMANPVSNDLAKEMIPQQIVYGAIAAGGGIAMTVLGIRSILSNRRYNMLKREQDIPKELEY